MAKKNAFDMIAKNFLKDNAVGVVKHIFLDALVPRTADYLKEAAYYAVTETAKSLIFQGKAPVGITSAFDFYGKNSGNGNGLPNNRMNTNSSVKAQFRKRIDYNNIVLSPDRDNFGIIQTTARDKYERMMTEVSNIFASEGRLRVLDLYNILGVSGTVENDVISGWTSLDGYSTRIQTNGDIILKLPAPRQF